MLILLLVALTLTPFNQAEDLFARARRLNPTLADYQAKTELQLDATMGPLQDRRKLTGTYYYKREGRHKLDLPDAPSYLKEHANVLGFSLPRLERYTVTKLEATRWGQEPAWRLELLPKTPQGSIERLEMWFARREGTVLEYDTYYSNGQLLVTLGYVKAGKYRVPGTMKARFTFPGMGLKATVHAQYSGFKFNQGLSDRLFDR